MPCHALPFPFPPPLVGITRPARPGSRGGGTSDGCPLSLSLERESAEDFSPRREFLPLSRPCPWPRRGAVRDQAYGSSGGKGYGSSRPSRAVGSIASQPSLGKGGGGVAEFLPLPASLPPCLRLEHATMGKAFDPMPRQALAVLGASSSHSKAWCSWLNVFLVSRAGGRIPTFFLFLFLLLLFFSLFCRYVIYFSTFQFPVFSFSSRFFDPSDILIKRITVQWIHIYVFVFIGFFFFFFCLLVSGGGRNPGPCNHLGGPSQEWLSDPAAHRCMARRMTQDQALGTDSGRNGSPAVLVP